MWTWMENFGMLLHLLKHALRGDDIAEPHPETTAQGDVLINIENDHQWTRTVPAGLNSESENESYHSITNTLYYNMIFSIKIHMLP